MKKYQTRFQMMGTLIDLVVYHEDGEQLVKAVYRQLAQYAQRFSANHPGSDLMRINRSAGIAPVPVEDDLFQLINVARAASQNPDNPFNIAIGPLVKLWRIGFQDVRVPSATEISARLALVDPDNIILNEQKGTVFLQKSGMEIDLGAIAKGYFADQVKQALVDAGVESGFISLGGNVVTIGHSPTNANRAWNVGIQNPLAGRGEIIRAVPLNDASMVTSGINERFFEANGQRYHHLLDAQTGMPIATDIASLTIISKNSIDGEIWSTAGFLSSAEDALACLNQQAGIEAVVVAKDGTLQLTDGLVDHGRYIALR
ncbi:FAD:protein FMN transferase [Endozoicomonas sp. SESOKO1]|uniref:FAD:protein FMN transferase n=1 Tax=Endozoicomonas sp. SESOKO1 TaxID=2828742 RepID=UPI0021488D00|nr:FAD:protein FMN transferase [Endozoicomonas sp. SESOKO1]